MIQPFFITGYPRSRTAWLANFLTWGDTFCFHDAFRLCESTSDLPRLFLSAGTPYVGNSDPANVLFQDQLIKLFPDAKWIVIEREFEEARKSARRALGIAPDKFALFRMKLTELRTKVPVTVFDWDELDQGAETVAACINPNFSSPPGRNAMLKTFNVQIDPAYYKRAMKELKANRPRWFEEVER